jgi:HSP20 family protein
MTILKYYRPNRFSNNGNEQDHCDQERLQDLFFGSANGNTVARRPMANVYEDTAGFRIEMAMPGVRKSNIKIHVEKEVLSVSIDQKENTEDSIILKEYDFTAGQRSFILPESVNTEKISSKLENGMLDIMLPKKESAIPKGPTNIHIN